MLSFSARSGIRRRGRRRWALLSAIAVRIGNAEIVLGVLIEIFRSDTVVPDRGFPRERDVAFKDLIGAAADPYVWAVAVEDLVALR